jgi:hypothetical protein
MGPWPVTGSMGPWPVTISSHGHVPCNRREALRTAARWLALGGLATLSGGLLLREPAPRDGHTCRLVRECRQCRAFSGCRLPRAVDAKERNAQP